jgi:putative hydrolase of the HAD superfamily
VSGTGVRAVLWDADGVLQRVPNGWEESMRPAIAGLVADPDEFLAAAYDAERPALTGDVRWLDVLPGLLAEWGIADAYDDVVRVWLTIEEVPGTHELVRALRSAGVRCCLATNQDEHRAKVMHEQLGYGDLLDETFYSYELRAAKPDPAYFGTVLARLDLAPDEVLFVDDSARNVEAARSLGLRAELWSHEVGISALRELLVRHGLPVGR